MSFTIVNENIIMWNCNDSFHIAHIQDEAERKAVLEFLCQLYYHGLDDEQRGEVHGYVTSHFEKRRSTAMFDSFNNEIFEFDIIEISRAKGLAFVFWRKDWKMWIERSLERNYYMGGGMLSSVIYPSMHTRVIGNLYDPKCREIVAKAWKKYFPPESYWRKGDSYA